MATFRRFGTHPDDHVCAHDYLRHTYLLANGLLDQLLLSFREAAQIPGKLRFSDAEPDGWHGAEQVIGQAVNKGDWMQTIALCDAYLERVRRFCTANRPRAEVAQ